jgi:hypothetical protein
MLNKEKEEKCKERRKGGKYGKEKDKKEVWKGGKEAKKWKGRVEEKKMEEERIK